MVVSATRLKNALGLQQNVAQAALICGLSHGSKERLKRCYWNLCLFVAHRPCSQVAQSRCGQNQAAAAWEHARYFKISKQLSSVSKDAKYNFQLFKVFLWSFINWRFHKTIKRNRTRNSSQDCQKAHWCCLLCVDHTVWPVELKVFTLL